MKMNIKGLVFVGFAAAVFASAANAADGDNKKVTSYQYTENTYEKKANKVQTLDPNATAAQKAINYPSQAAIEDLVGAEYSGQGLIDVSASHVITTTAEQNVIEGVKLNGTAVTIDSDKDAVVNALTGVTQNGTAVTVTNGVAATTDTVTTVAQGGTDGTVSVTVGSAAPVDIAVKNVEITDHMVQTIDSNSTNATYPSAQAVYNFLNNGAGTANCSDTNPCAFVLGSGAPEWKPIQQ